MSHTKKTYWEHRINGLCPYCHNSVIPGRGKCSIHAQRYSGYSKKVNESRKLNKRCTGCGFPLHEEIDEGYVKCITCRQHYRRLIFENTGVESSRVL